jgi:hypothetical protein
MTAARACALRRVVLVGFRSSQNYFSVMPAKAGIHVLLCGRDVDGRDIGELSDAVLRTAKPGHDE